MLQCVGLLSLTLKRHHLNLSKSTHEKHSVHLAAAMHNLASCFVSDDVWDLTDQLVALETVSSLKPNPATRYQAEHELDQVCLVETLDGQ